jgi:hypothetical protein
MAMATSSDQQQDKEPYSTAVNWLDLDADYMRVQAAGVYSPLLMLNTQTQDQLSSQPRQAHPHHHNPNTHSLSISLSPSTTTTAAATASAYPNVPTDVQHNVAAIAASGHGFLFAQTPPLHWELQFPAGAEVQAYSKRGGTPMVSSFIAAKERDEVCPPQHLHHPHSSASSSAAAFAIEATVSPQDLSFTSVLSFRSSPSRR